MSVNRFDGKMPIPVPMPEQDPGYDSEHNFKARRKTQRNTKLEPLKVKHDFLRRGQGNGGSPTTHEVGKRAEESGMVTLSPISRKQAAHSNVRVRNKAGGYQYISAGSLNESAGKAGDMSPRQRRELEKKNRVQQKIAEFRMLKYQREQEKLRKEEEEAEAQRQKLAEAQERRARYMETQRAKLQEYQVARALELSQQALKEEEGMRAAAEREARRRAGE